MQRLFCCAHIHFYFDRMDVLRALEPLSRPRYASLAYFTCTLIRCFGCNIEPQVMKEGGPTTDPRTALALHGLWSIDNRSGDTLEPGDMASFGVVIHKPVVDIAW